MHRWNAFRQAANRRTFLKGLGLGAGGALLSPILSRLQAEANGAQLPPRVVFVVEGNGFYGFKDWKKLTMGSPEIATLDTLPDNVSNLERYRERMVLLNGLANKQGKGRYAGHESTYYALTCMPYAGSGPGGISIDQHLAQTLGADDIFPSIRLGATEKASGLLAVTSAAGPGVGLPTQHDPNAAFNELFGVVAANASDQTVFTERSMMLDYMHEDVQRMTPRLASEEKWKLERYLYAIETFQLRQQRLEANAEALSMCAPAEPYPLPADPEQIEATLILQNQFKLATMSLICGLTRVAVIAAGAGKYCHTAFQGWGYGGKHAMGHGSNGGGTSLKDIHNRIASLIGTMADELDQIPEGDGSMLDNTLIVFLNDNGHEHHSKYDNFPVVLLGDLQGKLQTGGRLIDYPNHQQANSRGLPEVWNAVCHACGFPKDDFAKDGRAPSDGPLPEIMAG